ncbi:olfactory receptor-like protein OLF4 [Bombina bombina]|uniref:olfactory receptor-like protein OLF4 n=1 Tax=Bombina bombina TaxID=8345 RepID=UPI00235AAE24|nr:olfactory receptor-like protein OLF4 [Bombina bombina]
MNQTYFRNFTLIGFSSNVEKQPFVFTAFFLVYLVGVVSNLLMIILISTDSHLHTPMYILLCNLAFADICTSTVTLIKLMDILATGNNTISFLQCFTQMFFFILLSDAEIVLLSVMSYDRYVAICKPLHYYIIMNRKKCSLLLVAVWVLGFLNSLPLTCYMSALNVCASNEIPNFYCDFKAMTKIFCTGLGFSIMTYTETLLGGLFPFLLSLMSYYKIITCILRIKSTNGRRKAFSTCVSHLTVLAIFYGTLFCIYAKPTREHAEVLDQLFSIGYTVVTPILNPLIYSLRNKEVKSAMKKVFRDKQINFRVYNEIEKKY